MSQQNDDLGDGQPVKSQGTGVKRLNRLPVAVIACLVVGGLGTAIYSIHATSARQAENTADDDKGITRSDSFVNTFLAGRPDGVIGDASASDSLEVLPAAPEPEPVEILAKPAIDKNEERWQQALFKEQLRVAQMQRSFEEQALRSGSVVKFDVGGNSLSGRSATSQRASSGANRRQEANDRRQQLYAQLGVGGVGGAPDGAFRRGTGDYQAQNNQAGKRAFARSSDEASHYLGEFREAALSPLEVKAGSIIPAVLITGVNSDLPGQMIAQVSHNVFDTVNGSHVLIPQGAKLIGRYDSTVSMGQNRLLVVWDRLIYPDGSSINIKGMQGTDQTGYSGFKDQVNNHYARIFGHALLMSIVSASVQLAGDDDGGSDERDVFQDAIAQEIGRVSSELIRRQMNIQPTIEIRPGYAFAVMVNKDMILPPYQPMQQYLADNRDRFHETPPRQPVFYTEPDGR